MTVNRRGFIKGMLAAMGAAAALDPEELLWLPGAKVISIPSVVPPRAVKIGELTDGERYLCAAMGISETAFILRRAEMHRKNGLSPGYFRREYRSGGHGLVGAAFDDGVDIVKQLGLEGARSTLR